MYRSNEIVGTPSTEKAIVEDGRRAIVAGKDLRELCLR
jgi:hypothetical protein